MMYLKASRFAVSVTFHRRKVGVKVIDGFDLSYYILLLLYIILLLCLIDVLCEEICLNLTLLKTLFLIIALPTLWRQCSSTFYHGTIYDFPEPCLPHQSL